MGKWAQVTGLIALRSSYTSLPSRKKPAAVRVFSKGHRGHRGSGLPGGGESHSLNENVGMRGLVSMDFESSGASNCICILKVKL